MTIKIALRRIVVSVLSSLLLGCCIIGIAFSQDESVIDLNEWLAEDTVATEKELTVDEIYDESITSLIWIVTDGGRRQGSGVLIDTETRLAVTNHHVVEDDESVGVFFPVRDLKGDLIDDRDFYLNKKNWLVLSRLGYAVLGRIIAKDKETDLAIVQLDGFPDTARQIKHNLSHLYEVRMRRGDKVHCFGNPGGQKLWKWDGGWFQQTNQTMFEISASVYKGYSGGPVLNAEGILIGIATRSNELHKAWVVQAGYIRDLLVTLRPRQIFTISNTTSFPVRYDVRWSEDDTWSETTLKPFGVLIHWYTEASKPIPERYPEIRFDGIVNDGKFTPKLYWLQTYSRTWGAGVPLNHREGDREYYFKYNSDREILDLFHLTP